MGKTKTVLLLGLMCVPLFGAVSWLILVTAPSWEWQSAAKMLADSKPEAMIVKQVSNQTVAVATVPKRSGHGLTDLLQFHNGARAETSPPEYQELAKNLGAEIRLVDKKRWHVIAKKSGLTQIAWANNERVELYTKKMDQTARVYMYQDQTPPSRRPQSTARAGAAEPAKSTQQEQNPTNKPQQ